MKTSLLNILMELPPEERKLLIEELRYVVWVASAESENGESPSLFFAKKNHNRLSDHGLN